jgi:5-methylcytosine-specific restriction endonuclease McrA
MPKKWKGHRGWRQRTPEEQRAHDRARERWNRRHARGWDGISDEQILRRDKYVCMMEECLHTDEAGNPDRSIDRELAGTGGPWAPSVDHAVPISEGGLDNARNKRAAHIRCNNEANRVAQLETPRSAAAPMLLGNPVVGALEAMSVSARVSVDSAAALLSLRDKLL